MKLKINADQTNDYDFANHETIDPQSMKHNMLSIQQLEMEE
jgi:hypothetical protein